MKLYIKYCNSLVTEVERQLDLMCKCELFFLLNNNDDENKRINLLFFFCLGNKKIPSHQKKKVDQTIRSPLLVVQKICITRLPPPNKVTERTPFNGMIFGSEHGRKVHRISLVRNVLGQQQEVFCRMTTMSL